MNPIEVVQDQNVLLLTSMINSGDSVRQLLESMTKFKPKNIKIATAFQKRSSEFMETNTCFANYTGFVLPSSPFQSSDLNKVCFIGYGVDCFGKFKDLPHLCIVNQIGIKYS